MGATETVLLSAVRAEGKTVLRNAATEPEVVELALFLQRMGAHIELSPDRRIVIEGVPRLRGASRWLAGDRLDYEDGSVLPTPAELEEGFQDLVVRRFLGPPR